MNKKLKKLVLFIFLILIILGCLSSYLGWYGYRYWENRNFSNSIKESRERGVFIKNLNYKIDSFERKPFKFEVFVEKGFRWGKNTSNETRVIQNSEYPYQLSFNSRPNNDITFLIRKSDLAKFDSTNTTWGFWKSPIFKDTITLNVFGPDNQDGIIKVWE